MYEKLITLGNKRCNGPNPWCRPVQLKTCYRTGNCACCTPGPRPDPDEQKKYKPSNLCNPPKYTKKDTCKKDTSKKDSSNCPKPSSGKEANCRPASAQPKGRYQPNKTCNPPPYTSKKPGKTPICEPPKAAKKSCSGRSFSTQTLVQNPFRLLKTSPEPEEILKNLAELTEMLDLSNKCDVIDLSSLDKEKNILDEGTVFLSSQCGTFSPNFP